MSTRFETKPWKFMGISRATYYRRLKAALAKSSMTVRMDRDVSTDLGAMLYGIRTGRMGPNVKL
jgi:hypothetical protein